MVMHHLMIWKQRTLSRQLKMELYSIQGLYLWLLSIQYNFEINSGCDCMK